MAIHTAPREPADPLNPTAAADDDAEDSGYLPEDFNDDVHHDEVHQMPTTWAERHAIRLEADHLVEVLGG